MTARRVAALAVAGLTMLGCGGGTGGGTGGGAAPSPAVPVSSATAADPAATLALVAGEQLTCRVAATVRCWGGNPFLTDDPRNQPAGGFEPGDGGADLAIGRHHACLLEHGGSVACWGSDLDRQLGVETVAASCFDRPCSQSLVTVPGLPAIAALTAGAFHTCALARDGTVWCWGDNELGQLGRLPSPEPGGPAKVVGLTGVRHVAAGFLHTCAAQSDGTVWCWGDAGDGRLGRDSDDPALPAPQQVAGLGGPAVAVTAGVTHSCALLADGSVWCWGGNRFGELGDGTADARSRPAPVGGLPDPVAELVAGDHFTCARTGAGAVLCWGWNDTGQLGLGSFDGPDEPDGFSAALTPQGVHGLPGPARALAAGAGHACAELAGGTWCWGRNEAGQLGDGSLLDQPAPVVADFHGRPPARPAAAVAAHDIRGIDVSYHSGRVDWSQIVAAGNGFAFTLSTAGLDFHDPLFFSHWARMDGLHRGAYHFFVAHDDPAAQARWFIANTPLGPGDLAPVVDIETMGDDPPGDLPARLRVFVAALEAHYGVKPIVYTGPRFWDRYLGAGYGDHALWVAEYGVEQPSLPTGWHRWTLWQDRGDATVPGVERVADLSRIADSATLAALVIPPR